MKRVGNLYENIYKLENIMQGFDEVCRNTKNKRRVNKYKEFKCMYIYRIYNILVNRSYVVGEYKVFTISKGGHSFTYQNPKELCSVIGQYFSD